MIEFLRTAPWWFWIFVAPELIGTVGAIVFASLATVVSLLFDRSKS